VTVLPNDLHNVNKLRISTGAYWPHLSDGELEVSGRDVGQLAQPSPTFDISYTSY
jgi:hypothetical protein